MNLFPLVLLLGLRHGIDWDHIAAITDIVSSLKTRREAIIQATFYILGHAIVVFTIGILVMVLGVYIPESVDEVMTKVVGITLILLGIWVLLSIIVEGKAFHPRSRFMILALVFQKIQMFLHDHISHHHHKKDLNEVVVGKKASLTLGMVHGIGAETPTQMLLFVTAAGIQRTVLAPLILLTFIGGLLISNSVIATLSVLGYKAVSKSSWLRIGLGLLTAIVSIYVGVAFLGGNESTLPALLGG